MLSPGREFRLFTEKWQEDRRPSVVEEWIAQHANNRGIGTDDVETELFEAMIGKRQELLSAAADSQSVGEQLLLLTQAGDLVQLIGQFLLDLNETTADRFNRVYGQFTQWIGFRKNAGDKILRDQEEQFLMKLLDAASNEASAELLPSFLPDRWDFEDMGDGSVSLRKALREKCSGIVYPKAARHSLTFLKQESAIRTLSEAGRFEGVKCCLFDPRSPIWNGPLFDRTVGIIRKGDEDVIIYNNVRDYLEPLPLVRGTQRGDLDFVTPDKVAKVLGNEEFAISLWRIATSREIQYLVC